MLRGRWCNVITPTEEKNDNSEDSFREELKQVIDHFPKYYMKILLEDFNAKLGKVVIFKPAIGTESLHEGSNHNGVRIVTLPHPKI